MALVTVTQLQNEMPNVSLSATTRPTLTQVTEYISSTESEVRAYLQACDAPFPTDASTPQGQFVMRTILEGTRWLVLRAIEGLVGSDGTSADVDRSYQAYKDKLSNICKIAKSALNEGNLVAGQQPAANYPRLGRTDLQPNLASTFSEYTYAVERVDTVRTARRSGARLPWPLL